MHWKSYIEKAVGRLYQRYTIDFTWSLLHLRYHIKISDHALFLYDFRNTEVKYMFSNENEDLQCLCSGLWNYHFLHLQSNIHFQWFFFRNAIFVNYTIASFIYSPLKLTVRWNMYTSIMIGESKRGFKYYEIPHLTLMV